MKKRILSIAVLLLAISLTAIGCGQQTTVPGSGQQDSTGIAASTPTYMEISADQLKSMMSGNKSLYLLDVRESDEYAQGHLDKSFLIPIGQIHDRIKEIPKAADVVVVCASGARSSQVAEYLAQNGYPKVYNLSGGLVSWPDVLVK